MEFCVFLQQMQTYGNYLAAVDVDGGGLGG